MNQNSTTRLYAAMGIAGQAGCLTVVLAVGALLVGVWLDQVFGTRHILVLVCVAVSVPINLVVTLRLTQRMIARVIPPDKPKGSQNSASQNLQARPNVDDNEDQ